MKLIRVLISALLFAVILSGCTSGDTQTSVDVDTTDNTTITANSTSAPDTTSAHDTTTESVTTAQAETTEPHVHHFKAATCTSPGVCECGATYGDPVPHTFSAPTCTSPATCVCGATYGEPIAHSYAPATCTSPATCACGATQGAALGHKFSAATCTVPKTCSVCKATEGGLASHDATEATLLDAGVCRVCNKVITPATKDSLNYDGYEFRVLVANTTTNTINDFDGSNTASVLGMAAYTRNTRMQQNYNVVIEVETDLRADHSAERKIKTQNIAQSNDYNLTVINTYAVANLAADGMLRDLSSVPNLDLSREWWDASVIRDLTISGSVYFASGDITNTVNDYTYVTLFNKGLAQELYPFDLYQLVKEGKWTIDKLAMMTRRASVDINGDDMMTDCDRYGFIFSNDTLLAMIGSAGGNIAEFNGQGRAELTLSNSTAQSAVAKFFDFAYDRFYAFNYEAATFSGGNSYSTMFKNSQALFFATYLNDAYQFRNTDSDYGVLPYPKLAENTAWYCPVYLDYAAFVAIPLYQDDIESTGMITELLGYEGTGIIVPAYYDNNLRGKYVRDEESIESFDIIFNNKTVDIGGCYKIGDMSDMLSDMVSKYKTDFNSAYNNALAAANADLSDLNNKLQNLKNN